MKFEVVPYCTRKMQFIFELTHERDSYGLLQNVFAEDDSIAHVVPQHPREPPMYKSRVNLRCKNEESDTFEAQVQ